jgi:hypothetical protein
VWVSSIVANYIYRHITLQLHGDGVDGVEHDRSEVRECQRKKVPMRESR